MGSTTAIEERLAAALQYARDADATGAEQELRAAAEGALTIEPADERAAVLTDIARLAVGLGLSAPLDELLAASETAWVDAEGSDCVGAWECRLARAIRFRVFDDWSSCRQLVRDAPGATVTEASADTLVRALHVFAMAELKVGSADAAESALARADAIAAQHDVEPYTRMELARSRGLWALRCGAVDDAIEAFDEARMAAIELQPPQPTAVARCLRSTALALLRAEQFDEASRTIDRALAMLDALPQPPGLLAELLIDAAALCYRRGDEDGSSALAERALVVAEEVWPADDPRLIHLLCSVATFHIERGGVAAQPAEDLLLRAVGLASCIAPEGPGAAEARALLGRYYARVERFDEAVGTLAHALSSYQRMEAPGAVVAEVMRSLALLFFARGEIATALEGLEAALAEAPADSPQGQQIQSDLARVKERI